MPPKLNRERALFVLDKIDEILAWKQRKEKRARHQFRGTRPLLCEVRQGNTGALES